MDQIIEGIAAQNGLTFGQLLDADYQGISYAAYRQQIAQQLMMSEKYVIAQLAKALMSLVNRLKR